MILFILFIGFAGPLFATALKTSVATYLQERSRQILSADLAINSTRPFRQEEVDRINETLHPLRQSQETEFVTMAKGPQSAMLVEVKGVDQVFPIFGEFRFKSEGVGTDARKTGAVQSTRELQEAPIAWAFPEVLAQLGLKVGDKVGIGRSEFRIVAQIEDAPGQGRTSGFAPRLYIGREFIKATGLTATGSQVFYRMYVELPAGGAAETAEAQVKSALGDPDIFIKTPDDSIQGFERFFKFFNLYLSALTMIVFVLSWISAFYILQVYLQDRLREAAVVMIFGASRLKTGTLYFLQILGLMLGAFLLATLFVIALIWSIDTFAPGLLARLLPKGFVLQLSLKDWLGLWAVAAASALAFITPFFIRLYSFKLQTLLGETAMGVERISKLRVVLGYSPMVLVFLGLAIWLMNSFSSAMKVAGGMLVAAVFGLLLGRAFFKGFFRLVRRRPGILRLVGISLSRSRFGVNLCFLSLVLVALVMNLVPHLLKSVISEVQPLTGREVPALFLFNIPELQVDDLKNFTIERNAELRFLSPMVVARLMKANGEPIDSDQFQRFPVRLSYREKRIPSEKIVSGQDFAGRFDSANGKPAEISMEAKFASRNDFKLGDVLEFDVQGVPLSGVIKSLRSVRWTDFNPNFFIMFQPGVLDDAPKTYLANVNLPGGNQDEEAKVKFQYDLVRKYPDISILDIGRTVGRVLEVAQSVINPIEGAAGVIVFISFLILIGVISHNLRLRSSEVDVEKLLGADAGLIRRILVSEYVATAFFAWIVGSLAALLISWSVTSQIFEISSQISWSAISGSGAVILALTAGIAYWSCNAVLGLRGTSRKL